MIRSYVAKILVVLAIAYLVLMIVLGVVAIIYDLWARYKAMRESEGRKKEKKFALNPKKYLSAIPVAAIFLLAYGAHCRGYCFSVSFLIWLFGSLFFLAASAIYVEIKRSERRKIEQR